MMTNEPTDDFAAHTTDGPEAWAVIDGLLRRVAELEAERDRFVKGKAPAPSKSAGPPFDEAGASLLDPVRGPIERCRSVIAQYRLDQPYARGDFSLDDVQWLIDRIPDAPEQEPTDDEVERVALAIREHHWTHTRLPRRTNEPSRTFHQGDKEAARAAIKAMKP